MIRLTNPTSDLISLITAQNGAKTLVCYTDVGASYAGGNEPHAITTATTTTICATPGASTVRDVDFISVQSTYAGAHVITLQASISGTLYPIITATLNQYDTLLYTHGGAITVKDSTGATKFTVSNVVVAAGKTLTVSESMTLAAGGAGQTYTFPSTSATIARTDAANTFTGNQGIGRAPRAWAGTQVVLEMPGGCINASTGEGAAFTASNNAYYDGAWKYKAAGAAARLDWIGGQVVTYTAASGSADAAITWVAGPYLTNTGTSWTNSSDISDKEDLTPATVLDKLDGFQLYEYLRISSQKREIGVIAQYVDPNFPLTVDRERGAGKWGVQYDRYGPIALMGVKQLRDQNAALKSILVAKNLLTEAEADAL